MEKQDYQNSLTVQIVPEEAVDNISQVAKWWSLVLEGNSSKPGDVFTVRFKGGDWYKIEIDEIIPDKKIVWNVIDSDQTWHEDRKEWAGTRIVWEISSAENGSKVTMTHLGLTPEAECYTQCKKGWDYLINESLYKFLTEGAGLPV